MADYKIPNLCGASEKFNAIQSKLDTMVSDAIDGLEVDASALKATMDTDVTSLVSDLKAMIPELPALPDVNLQGQLTSLAGLAAGSGLYNTLLANVSSKFGSGLTAGGFSLDTLVSDAAAAITGGTDLCSAVPNFSVPEAGGMLFKRQLKCYKQKLIRFQRNLLFYLQMLTSLLQKLLLKKHLHLTRKLVRKCQLKILGHTE